MTHSGNQRRPAKRFAIGPNERTMARNGPLRRGRPATKSEGVVVFMGRSCARTLQLASRQPVSDDSRKTVMLAQATPLRIAQAVASARPRASILRYRLATWRSTVLI